MVLQDNPSQAQGDKILLCWACRNIKGICSSFKKKNNYWSFILNSYLWRYTISTPYPQRPLFVAKLWCGWNRHHKETEYNFVVHADDRVLTPLLTIEDPGKVVLNQMAPSDKQDILLRECHIFCGRSIQIIFIFLPKKYDILSIVYPAYPKAPSG